MHLYDSCKKCGSDEGVYITEQYKGTAHMKYNFDGSDQDNVEVYDGMTSKQGVYVYCQSCNQRVMTVREFIIKTQANR